MRLTRQMMTTMIYSRKHIYLLVVGLVFLVSLACNLPARRTTIPPPPTLAPAPLTSPVPDAAATSTLPITGTSAGVLPTFTPIALPGTPLSESTISDIPLTLTPLTTPTSTLPLPQGALSFTYTVEWSISEQNPFLAVALVTLTPQGGNGIYTYYHDDIRKDGPTFTYAWAVCRANPGSLRVDSGDGQTVRVNYYENPPCPNP